MLKRLEELLPEFKIERHGGILYSIRRGKLILPALLNTSDNADKVEGVVRDVFRGVNYA